MPHSHDAALQIFTSQHDDSQPPLGLHWQTDRYLICGLTGASQKKKKKKSWEFKLSGYFSKTNSVAGGSGGSNTKQDVIIFERENQAKALGLAIKSELQTKGRNIF